MITDNFKTLFLKWLTLFRVIISTVLLIGMPVISYLLFEYVTGNLTKVSSLWMAGLNVCWITAIYLLIFALCGHSRIVVPLVSFSLFLLSVAEAFVVSFRGRPIMFWDIPAIRTAASVSANYDFTLTHEMKLAGVILLAVNLLLFFYPKKIQGRKPRLIFAGGVVGLVTGFGIFFYSFLVPSWKLGINMWDVALTYQDYGYVLATAASFQYEVEQPPNGYNAAKVNAIYDELAEPEELLLASSGGVDLGKSSTTVPVNIICIMNESLSDLRTGGDFETNQDYFPFLYSLDDNTVRGSLCVPVFGGTTSNTEYEFLTGNSMALLRTNCVAYQFYVKNNTYSLVSTLKAQGYKTVAMHPYPGTNWNRVEAYNHMGFDEFLDLDAYEDSELLRYYVSDRADYKKLIEMVERKENPDDRLFLFNVTMQNHGGYEGLYDNFPQKVWLTGELEGNYPKTDQYLSLMKASDQALEYLISYFEESEEPTMIVLFGDHQPSVENEFYNEIAGMPSSEIPDADHLMWYKTPFFIWTNYPSQSADKGDMGAVYLSSEVLNVAGLALTPFNRFMLDMEEKLPVIHPIGCYDRKGNYYSWEDVKADGSPYREIITDYEYLVYNQVFDTRTKAEVFVVGGE